jgi:hypothetical protein
MALSMARSMRYTAKIIMIGFLSLILLAHFSAPVFAGQKTIPTFTNKDLEKYKYPSDKNAPADLGSPLQQDTKDKQSKDEGHEARQKLRRFEVPYDVSGGTARIILPVTFNGSVTVPMLLDTGASGTHISMRLAEKLGIFRKDEGNLLEAISGIGGTVPAILTIIDSAKIGEAEDNFIPTTISDSISPDFEGLIGMDFMSNFTIKIDTGRHVVTFEELPQRSDMPGGHDETWWRQKFHEFASKRADWKSKRDSIYERYSVNGASEPAVVLRKKGSMTTITVMRMKEFVDYQYEEADKLLRKLDGYAVDNSVPMEWREY